MLTAESYTPEKASQMADQIMLEAFWDKGTRDMLCNRKGFIFMGETLGNTSIGEPELLPVFKCTNKKCGETTTRPNKHICGWIKRIGSYDPELKCQACGAVGLNQKEWEPQIIGDKEVGGSYLIICECGHVIKDLEDGE